MVIEDEEPDTAEAEAGAEVTDFDTGCADQDARVCDILPTQDATSELSKPIGPSGPWYDVEAGCYVDDELRPCLGPKEQEGSTSTLHMSIPAVPPATPLGHHTTRSTSMVMMEALDIYQRSQRSMLCLNLWIKMVEGAIKTSLNLKGICYWLSKSTERRCCQLPLPAPHVLLTALLSHRNLRLIRQMIKVGLVTANSRGQDTARRSVMRTKMRSRRSNRRRRTTTMTMTMGGGSNRQRSGGTRTGLRRPVAASISPRVTNAVITQAMRTTRNYDLKNGDRKSVV